MSLQYDDMQGKVTDYSDHTEQTSSNFKYGYPDSPPGVGRDNGMDKYNLLKPIKKLDR